MTTNRRSPAAVLVAVAVMLSPVAYVLSTGPATWLNAHGYLSDSAAVIYAPLIWCGQHCKPAGDALLWYVELWR